MRNRFAILSLLVLLSGAHAQAAPPDAALQQQLLSLYDRYGSLSWPAICRGLPCSAPPNRAPNCLVWAKSPSGNSRKRSKWRS